MADKNKKGRVDHAGLDLHHAYTYVLPQQFGQRNCYTFTITRERSRHGRAFNAITKRVKERHPTISQNITSKLSRDVLGKLGIANTPASVKLVHVREVQEDGFQKINFAMAFVVSFVVKSKITEVLYFSLKQKFTFTCFMKAKIHPRCQSQAWYNSIQLHLGFQW